MKTTTAVLVLAVVAASPSGWAQGTLNFASGGVGVNAPIYDIDGVTKLAGSAYLAGLWWSPVPTETSAEALAFAGITHPFATGYNAGYFLGGIRPVDGTYAGQEVAVQVRVWRPQDGQDFDSARHRYGAHFGMSNILRMHLGSGLGVPGANLIGLQSFHLISNIPEPPPFTLAVLGGVVLLLCRRVRPRP